MLTEASKTAAPVVAEDVGLASPAPIEMAPPPVIPADIKVEEILIDTAPVIKEKAEEGMYYRLLVEILYGKMSHRR